jgi:diacylglycerol kinase
MVKRPWKHSNLKQSLRGALGGIRLAFATERYARILFFMGIFTIMIGIILDISALELTLLIIVITGACVCEIFNTLVENFLDILIPKNDVDVRALKDMSSAAVLLASVGAFIVAEIILLPKIVLLWKNYLAK